MKKLFSIILATVLIGSFAACGSKPEAELLPSDVSVLDESLEETPVATVSTEPIVVMDAAMYRGTVVELSMDGDAYLLTLEEYSGRSFGAAKIFTRIEADTPTSVDLSTIAIGDYLEVYYGGSIEAGIDEALNIIAVNPLVDAESRNYNGTIKEILPNPEKEGEGSLLMVDLNGENETVFNYNNNGETQFYLTFNDLKVGDQLNIFHGIAVTASMPPQIFALEVSELDFQDKGDQEKAPATPEERALAESSATA